MGRQECILLSVLTITPKFFIGVIRFVPVALCFHPYESYSGAVYLEREGITDMTCCNKYLQNELFHLISCISYVSTLHSQQPLSLHVCHLPKNLIQPTESIYDTLFQTNFPTQPRGNWDI